MRSLVVAMVLFGTACSSKEDSPKVVAIPSVDMVSIPKSRVRINRLTCDLIDQNTYDELLAGEGIHGDSEDRSAAVPEVEIELPAFKIDRYTVGCAQWRACVAAGACTQKSRRDCYDDLVQKTHEQAVELCRWRGGRLPTYEEWQRAVRGPSSKVTPFPDGHRPESSCAPGRLVTRLHQTCELTSEEGVRSYTDDGEEHIQETRCRSGKHGEFSLRVIPWTQTGRLDRYIVYGEKSFGNPEGPGYQFRCVVP